MGLRVDIWPRAFFSCREVYNIHFTYMYCVNTCRFYQLIQNEFNFIRFGVVQYYLRCAAISKTAHVERISFRGRITWLLNAQFICYLSSQECMHEFWYLFVLFPLQANELSKIPGEVDVSNMPVIETWFLVHPPSNIGCESRLCTETKQLNEIHWVKKIFKKCNIRSIWCISCRRAHTNVYFHSHGRHIARSGWNSHHLNGKRALFLPELLTRHAGPFRSQCGCPLRNLSPITYRLTYYWCSVSMTALFISAQMRKNSLPDTVTEAKIGWKCSRGVIIGSVLVIVSIKVQYGQRLYSIS